LGFWIGFGFGFGLWFCLVLVLELESALVLARFADRQAAETPTEDFPKTLQMCQKIWDTSKMLLAKPLLANYADKGTLDALETSLTHPLWKCHFFFSFHFRSRFTYCCFCFEISLRAWSFSLLC
jgi:hypothetical protein